MKQHNKKQWNKNNNNLITERKERIDLMIKQQQL
jgi:hypothetical protein